MFKAALQPGCKTIFVDLQRYENWTYRQGDVRRHGIGACLHRDKTLATGDSCCDYLYTRPGSEAEKRWLAEHPEGSFISK